MRSGAALLMTIAALSAGIAACSRGTPAHAPAQAPPSAANSTSVAPDTSGIDLLTAFKAAFGVPAPASVDVPANAGEDQAQATGALGDTPENGTSRLQFSPAQLFQLSPGLFVLVSKGVDPVGCHACSGILAVHYLKRTTDGFDLLSQSGPIGPRAGFGAAPDFTIRTDLFPFPALQVQESDGGQGCGSTAARLYELTPGGLVGHGDDIDLAGSYDGSGGSKSFDYSGTIVPDKRVESDTAYDGKVGPPHEVRAFKVVYKGTINGEVPYSPEGTPLRQLNLPSC
jgi:hypothetical protein